MPLATKNNSLIVKDGKVAENCNCCNGLCKPTREKATLTISGLPSSCRVGAFFNRRLGLYNRELDDDNCSYTLFRIRSKYTANTCKYATTWHGSNNTWPISFERTANIITIDVLANTLEYIADRGSARVVFSPPAGKSFSNLPFDEVLVPITVYQGDCPPDAFANVRVVIDDSAAAYVPYACPDILRTETCQCTPDVDTVPALSKSRVGNVLTVNSVIPIFSCAPCDSNHSATQTSTTVYKVPCISDEKNDCVESVSESSSWPELNVNVSFEGPDINGYSYATLSGAYALKWTSPAYTGDAMGLGLQFPGWGIVDPDGDGVGRPTADRLWWGVTDQLPQQGLINTNQGWRVEYRTALSGVLPMGMTLVVAPVKTTTTINRATKSIVSTPCGHGEIAYQIKLSVFDRPSRGIDSSYLYWSWSFSCFANVACAPRVCQNVPSISLNSTETVYVPIGGPYYDTYGKLGEVKVSVSS